MANLVLGDQLEEKMERKISKNEFIKLYKERISPMYKVA